MITDDKYRTSLCERRNNRTGATEWVIRFVHSSAEYGKFAWFDIPAGRPTFADREDYLWFCSFINRRKNVAIRFVTLKDALSFLEIIKSAEVNEDVADADAVQ